MAQKLRARVEQRASTRGSLLGTKPSRNGGESFAIWKFPDDDVGSRSMSSLSDQLRDRPCCVRSAWRLRHIAVPKLRLCAKNSWWENAAITRPGQHDENHFDVHWPAEGSFFCIASRRSRRGSSALNNGPVQLGSTRSVSGSVTTARCCCKLAIGTSHRCVPLGRARSGVRGTCSLEASSRFRVGFLDGRSVVCRLSAYTSSTSTTYATACGSVMQSPGR
jgi:hypothetical protein